MEGRRHEHTACPLRKEDFEIKELTASSASSIIIKRND
jgi:hypothetical protein